MFKIINSSSYIINHQINKEVGKTSALDILKKRSFQEKFKASDNWWRGRTDPIDSARNAKNFQRNYERVMPEKLDPQSSNIMWKRAKQLKDEFIIGMLSHEELHPTKGFLENGTIKHVVDESRMQANRSIERERMWQKNNENKIREFKNIMRHLNPGNSNAGDIERFRPRMRGRT